jgi:flagellar motility protein MotE (MotC chaperone)
MSDTNFYLVLGVERSASADEIKSAYRELVKRYHPDLFARAGEKAKATEKLRQINEAYSVLGNTESRRQYDQRFIQQPKVRARAPTARKGRGTSRPRRHADVRSTAAKILSRRPHFSKKRLGYAFACSMVVLVFIYASRSEPRLATAWTLMEKVEVSSAKGISPSDGSGQGWQPLGQYASVSECAGTLTQRVRKDEQEGSRAVFDEQKGTMAITVLVKKVEPERFATRGGAAKDEQRNFERAEAEASESISKNVTKRVRTLECRITQRLETDSWLQATLRRMGLL